MMTHGGSGEYADRPLRAAHCEQFWTPRYRAHEAKPRRDFPDTMFRPNGLDSRKPDGKKTPIWDQHPQFRETYSRDADHAAARSPARPPTHRRPENLHRDRGRPSPRLQRQPAGNSMIGAEYRIPETTPGETQVSPRLAEHGLQPSSGQNCVGNSERAVQRPPHAEAEMVNHDPKTTQPSRHPTLRCL